MAVGNLHFLHVAAMNSRFMRAMFCKLDALGTLSGAGTGVGAVAESEFVHLGNHGQSASVTLHSALGKAGELCAIFAETKSIAEPFLQAATQAPQPIQLAESMASSAITFEIGERVGVLRSAAVERHVAAGLLDLVERITVHHKVLDHGECRRERQGSTVIVSPSAKRRM